MPQYTLDGHESDGTDSTAAKEMDGSNYTIAFRLQRCGDSTCSCETGHPKDLHGPYEVHVYSVNGEHKPKYVSTVRDEFKQTTVNVIERDGNICQCCGERPRSGWLPVHHIRRPEAFDDPQEAHVEGNCVQVCTSCHGRVEQLDAETQRALFGNPNPIQQTLTAF